jgi:hypothetical protein
VSLNTNGIASFTLQGSFGASYYIVVKHRNSIETWAGNPVSFVAGSISYNFSSSASQAYGSNLKLISGKYVVFGCDVNQDGAVNTGDMLAMDNDVSTFAKGYISTDVNGDGVIDSLDMILLDNNAAIFVGKIVP